MKPVIFHIDVNSAFLSWTGARLLAQGGDVDIRTIPSAIGGDISKRRGVILAKSVPAKAFGVTTGEPITHALKKCPNLKIFQPDHSYYQSCSHQMLDLLGRYSPDITPYSIDECFMTYVPFPEAEGSPVKGAHIIREQIKKELGFTVNIGISSNRLLAKMASDFKKPDRVHTLFPDEIPKKMWPLPVQDLFMVGHSSSAALELLGIKTIGDLAHTDPSILVSHLKSHGQTIWEYANGVEKTSLIAKGVVAKGIGNSTTLSSDITDSVAAGKVLLQLAESVSLRLRKAGQCANMISVEIKYSDFSSASHQMQADAPTQNSSQISSYAKKLFSELWDGRPVRLLGIRTSKLEDENNLQLSLFDMTDNKKLRKLDKALDEIRRKYGKDAVVRGSFLKH